MRSLGLLAGGLLSQGQRGVYDRFRGRLVWPIRSMSDEVIGFEMPGATMAGVANGAASALPISVRRLMLPSPNAYRLGLWSFAISRSLCVHGRYGPMTRSPS